jgi:hypothetical protein
MSARECVEPKSYRAAPKPPCGTPLCNKSTPSS